MKNIIKLIALVSCLIFLTNQDSFAAKRKKKATLKLCIKGDQIVAKSKCKKDEKTFTKTDASAGALNAPTVKGPKGPNGFTGAQGSQGLPGTPGRSSFDPLRSGSGAFGAVGGDYNGDGVGTECSQVLYPVPLQSNNYPIIIVRNSIVQNYCPENDFRFNSCCYDINSVNQTQNCFANTQVDSRCSGNFQNPSSTGGALCVYPSQILNAFAPNIQNADRYGFKFVGVKTVKIFQVRLSVHGHFPFLN